MSEFKVGEVYNIDGYFKDIVEGHITITKIGKVPLGASIHYENSNGETDWFAEGSLFAEKLTLVKEQT